MYNNELSRIRTAVRRNSGTPRIAPNVGKESKIHESPALSLCPPA